MDIEDLKRVLRESGSGHVFDQACARYVIESATDRRPYATWAEIQRVQAEVKRA